MMENKDLLLKRIESGEALKYLFFWGHTRKGAGTDSSCLSQWFPTNFHHEGVEYHSAEQWMMAEKAKLFGDYQMHEEIINTTSPGKAKALGRQVKGFEQKIWEEERMRIVVKGNVLKFQSNDDFKTYLLNTQDRILVEASPVDPIWGIGMAKDHPKRYNPAEWRGLNLLGFALMEARRLLLEAE